MAGLAGPAHDAGRLAAGMGAAELAGAGQVMPGEGDGAGEIGQARLDVATMMLDHPRPGQGAVQ